MKKLIYTIIALACCAPAFAQITWTNDFGNGNNQWDTDQNWDVVAVPTDADEVIFDGSVSNDDCFLGGAEQALTITIRNNYTGTIEIDGAGSLTVGASGGGGNVFSVSATGFSGTLLLNNGGVLSVGGTFNVVATGNSGCTFTINGELYVGQLSVAAGTFNASGADAFECSPDVGFGIGTFSISGSTFTAPSGSMIIVGNISNRTTGTFSANGGTIRHIIRAASRSIGTGFTGSNAFNNLTLGVSGASNRALSLSGNVTVNGTLAYETSGSNYLLVNSNQIDVSGNLDNSLNLATGNVGGTTSIRLVGTTSQSIVGNTGNATGGNLPAVTITQGTGGTVSLSGRINLARGLTINSNGAISANTSTLAFQDGTNAAVLSGTTTTNVSLYSLLLNKSGSSLTVSSLSASWVTISNLLTVTAGTLNTGSKIALLSTASNTSAQVAAVGGTISGTVRVDRFITGATGRKWRFLASPVTTTAFISGNWQQQIHITGSGTGGTNCPS